MARLFWKFMELIFLILLTVLCCFLIYKIFAARPKDRTNELYRFLARNGWHIRSESQLHILLKDFEGQYNEGDEMLKKLLQSIRNRF